MCETDEVYAVVLREKENLPALSPDGTSRNSGLWACSACMCRMPPKQSSCATRTKFLINKTVKAVCVEKSSSLLSFEIDNAITLCAPSLDKSDGMVSNSEEGTLESTRGVGINAPQ
jgi:hypothetical protein